MNKPETEAQSERDALCFVVGVLGIGAVLSVGALYGLYCLIFQ